MAWPFPEDCVLGIFGAKPEVNVLPPRLVAEWGSDFASDLDDAMLFDTLETWDPGAGHDSRTRRVLAYAPADAGPWFDARVPSGLALQPRDESQPCSGDQLHVFIACELQEGASRVVVIGSNTPTLDPSIVISAFLCLEGRDVVLGPATDGALYLVGARNAAPPIFGGVDWSSPGALSQTLDRLENIGLSVALLPPWYRIVEPDHVRVAAAHIRGMRRTGLNPGVPRFENLIDTGRLSARSESS